MSDQTVNVVAKVNTKEVKDAKLDFKELKEKVAELSKEIPGLGQGFSTASSALKTLTGGIESAGAGLLGLVGIAVAAAAAMSGLGIAMAFKFNEVLDGYGDLAEKIGSTADQAYFLSTAAKQAGGDLQSLIQMGDRLNKAMTKSGDEVKGAGLAFARLGVETTDANGKLRASADVADELIEKWEKSAKTSSDYADMTMVLGKNFEQQLPVLKNVIEANKTANEFYEQGIGITKQSLEVTDQSEKAQLKLGAVFNSMGSILVETVIPAFTGLTSWFIKSYTEGGIVAKSFTAIALVTEAVTAAIKILAGGVILLVEGFSMGIDVIGTFGAVMWKAIKGDFSGAKDTMLQGMDKIAERSRSLSKDLEALTPHFEGSNLQKFFNGENLINKKSDDLSKPKDLNNVLFRGSAGGTPNADKQETDKSQDAIERLIETLTKQALAQGNANAVTIVGNDIERIRQDNIKKGLGPLSEANVLRAKAAALTLDEQKATKLLSDAQLATKKVADGYVDSLLDEVKARTMSARDLKQDQELRKLDLVLEEERKKLKDAGLLTIDRENQLLQQNADARQRVRNATVEAKKEDDDWVNRGFDAFIKKTGDVNTSLTNFVDGSLSKLTDGLTELATGGDFSFRSFAASIVKELAKMAIQFLIIIPIVKAFQQALNASSSGGSFWGSLASSFTSASANGNVFSAMYSNGGIMPNGAIQASNGNVANEAGQEAVLPVKRNAAGQLGVVASGGGGGNVTQVNNITINSGSNGNSKDDHALARTISDVIDKKWQENNKNAFRPGGVNNKVSLAV